MMYLSLFLIFLLNSYLSSNANPTDENRKLISKITDKFTANKGDKYCLDGNNDDLSAKHSVFTSTFLRRVFSSDIKKLFEISLSAEEADEVFYDANYYFFNNLDVAYPGLLAQDIATASKAAIPNISPFPLAVIFANTVEEFLEGQRDFKENNEASLGNLFYDSLVKSAVNNDGSDRRKIFLLTEGSINFLRGFGILTSKTVLDFVSIYVNELNVASKSKCLTTYNKPNSIHDKDYELVINRKKREISILDDPSLDNILHISTHNNNKQPSSESEQDGPDLTNSNEKNKHAIKRANDNSSVLKMLGNLVSNVGNNLGLSKIGLKSILGSLLPSDKTKRSYQDYDSDYDEGDYNDDEMEYVRNDNYGDIFDFGLNIFELFFKFSLHIITFFFKLFTSSNYIKEFMEFIIQYMDLMEPPERQPSRQSLPLVPLLYGTLKNVLRLG